MAFQTLPHGRGAASTRSRKGNDFSRKFSWCKSHVLVVGARIYQRRVKRKLIVPDDAPIIAAMQITPELRTARAFTRLIRQICSSAKFTANIRARSTTIIVDTMIYLMVRILLHSVGGIPAAEATVRLDVCIMLSLQYVTAISAGHDAITAFKKNKLAKFLLAVSFRSLSRRSHHLYANATASIRMKKHK
jgi:hypothetical protein